MNCNLCGGTNRVARLRVGGDSEAFVSVIDKVTCPRCVRGMTVLGTHEMLRGIDGIHLPGERLEGSILGEVLATHDEVFVAPAIGVDGPTGTIISGLIGGLS